MKSIIYFGTYTILHKHIIKIKSDKYYILKGSIIEEHERVQKYTIQSDSDIENMLKNIKKRENLNKEYFIRETPEITDDLENRWYVFEYESKTIPTFFNTTATNTITTFMRVYNSDESGDESDDESTCSYDKSTDSRYN